MKLEEHIHAAWVVLGRDRVKGDDLVANQLNQVKDISSIGQGTDATELTHVLTRGEPSGNVGSPLVTSCIATINI
jgi:hypothetical protein